MFARVRDIIRQRHSRHRLMQQHEALHTGRGTTIHDVRFGRCNSIGPGSDLRDVEIGDYSYIGWRSAVVSTRIGRFCTIAPEVNIGSGSHPSRGTISTHPAFYLSRPAQGWRLVNQDSGTEYGQTVIGNDVWIGTKAVIRDGVTIGDGVIIGAGAVVVKDLEPYGVYGGVPARLIRHRFPVEVVTRLLAFRWWDRDVDWLHRNAAAFRDPECFLTLIKLDQS